MNEKRWSIRVRWHTYGQSPTSVEWLELPPEFTYASIHERGIWISAYLREREGLPPDSRKPGEHVLWWEWDRLKPTAEVEAMEHKASPTDQVPEQGEG